MQHQVAGVRRNKDSTSEIQLEPLTTEVTTITEDKLNGLSTLLRSLIKQHGRQKACRRKEVHLKSEHLRRRRIADAFKKARELLDSDNSRHLSQLDIIEELAAEIQYLQERQADLRGLVDYFSSVA